MTKWRMRIECWIPETKNTHSEYVILIAFPLQQWLHERASLLRHTYIASLVLNYPQQYKEQRLKHSVRCQILLL